METIRAFIAIDTGEEIRSKLAVLQQEMKQTGADVRWSKPDTLHPTLAFPGNIPAETIKPLGMALDRQLHSEKRFKITARGLGLFGRRKRPGVVWTGIQPSPDLEDVRERVLMALMKSGIALEETTFHPHLTLGRFKSSDNAAPLFELLEKQRDVVFGETLVDSAHLYASDLAPEGAVHTVLHTARLA